MENLTEQSACYYKLLLYLFHHSKGKKKKHKNMFHINQNKNQQKFERAMSLTTQWGTTVTISSGRTISKNRKAVGVSPRRQNSHEGQALHTLRGVNIFKAYKKPKAWIM